MTEDQLRAHYIATATSYLGSYEGSGGHHEIVDIYNTIVPLPRGYRLTYSDDWCAGFVSAVAKKAGLLSIIFAECSCTRMGNLFNAVGGLKPKSYTPKPGDILLYDWDPSGNNGPDHVGIITAVNGTTLTVIEGNKNNTVEYRTVSTSSSNVWRYCAPNYASLASDPDVPPVEPISGNRYLTQAEMENNAKYIWYYLAPRGWTMNAVAGMLGNMQTESTINPGIWQSLNEGNTSAGFGLVQWTPATKLISWANSQELNYKDMDTQLARIEYELSAGIQYYKTDAYPLSFAQFKVSTKDPYYLGMAFLANYERPAVSNQPKRGQQAEAWYEFLSGLPAPTDPSSRKKRGLSLLLMYQATKRKV